MYSSARYHSLVDSAIAAALSAGRLIGSLGIGNP
jgi:hypothetical protein